MEDEESGDSACNSSDGGGSRSWVQSPSYEPTQLLYSKEGAFGRMESTQLLSNDFYTRAFSRQKQEESDEEFVEDDELEALREQHEQIGVDADEDEGSQSDYEGDYEETQLLEQYNAHYNKTEYGQKAGQKTGHSRAGFLDSNQESSGEEEGDCEQTQLLETYNSSSYNKAEYEKEQLMQVPGKSKAIGSWLHENAGPRVNTEDGGNSITQRKQDQQEMLFRDRPKSELAQERICEFDMDLNVSLEEEMDCEYYGEPVNFNTQLVANSGYYNDTQLVTSSEKGYVDNANFGTNNKPVVSSGKEATTDYNLFTNGGKPNNSLLITNNINVDLRRDNDTHLLKHSTDAKVPSSSHGELRSFTTGITISAKQSGSEASESTPFQSNIGSIHAESIRISAVQPIAWHPKVELDESSMFSNMGGSHLLKKQGDKGKKSVESGSSPWQLSTAEPEWMRKYEGSGSLRSQNILGQSTRFNSTSYLLPPVEKGTIANNEKDKIAEQGGPSRQSFTPGIKPLLGSSIFPRGGYFQGKPAGSFGGSDKKSILPQQSAFGAGLSSPMSRLNYLDSADPGEDVQAEALDMVDKLVWLNTNDSVKDEPPKKPKKFFSSVPLAPSVRASDPALQVYEFEDTPQEDPVQKYGDMSFIKEIQAGWKKKADQGHLFSTLKKGKERDTDLLPEGERLSKLLNEEKRDLSFEPPVLLNSSNGKRLSTRLQDKLKENLENATEKNLNADGVGTNEQISEPRSDTLKHQTVKLEEKQLKTNEGLAEADDSGIKHDIEAGGNLAQEDDGDDKGSVAAHILTRRRTQGRNRREHIWSPAAVFLTEICSSPDKMDKSSNMSRKRKSLNIMLREQRTRKTRRKKGEEHVENRNNEVHDNLTVGNGNIISMSAQKRSRASSRKEEYEAEDVDSETLEEGRKKIKLLEASITRIPGTGGDNEADEPVDDGLRTRSLRNLPGRKLNGKNNHPNPTEPFRNGLVQKKLRSARRGHGGGGPGGLILADEGDQCDDGEVEVEVQKEVQEGDSCTSTSAATTSKDEDDQEEDAGLEVDDDDDDDDISSPVEDDGNFLFEKPSPVVLSNVEENAGVALPRGRMKRTRSIADVSSPTTPTPIFQPIPFPLVTGRRGRGAIVKPENMEDDHVLQLPTPPPPFAIPVAAGKGLRMRTMRKRKDPQMLAFASGSFLEVAREESASVSTEGSGRSRRRASVCVLFSHGLAEDTIKKQKKILEKLDGRVATKAAECTHFVTEKFVRTGNMLEAMAAGKYVVTFAWLESCEIANCFIDERNFILEDERKEKDMAFSMCTTLTNAQHKPLLQGVRVLLTPNITPKPQAIANIVHAAGGEVVEVYKGPSPDVDSKDFCMVISNEDDYDVCVPLLEQGAKVYKTELILSGIVSYHLDFSKHVLFEGYKSGRQRVGRGRPT